MATFWLSEFSLHFKDADRSPMQRYPKNTHITVEDFRRSAWKVTIASTIQKGYSSMWQALSNAATKAIESGDTAVGKALWLLADVSSMRLVPSSANEPFRPIMESTDGRSALPEDFDASDIAFFADIIDEMDDAWLKARLADLLWLVHTPRNPKFALDAIDAYRIISLDHDTWLCGGAECWQRALTLANMLGKGAGNRMKEMEDSIIAAFEVAKPEDGFLALWLSQLLAMNRLGRTKSPTIAEQLEQLALHFDTAGDQHRSREYFDVAANWYKRAGDSTKSVAMTVSVAEGWVKEAKARIASTDPSHMAAVTFCENAIQIYRTIPKSARTHHRVDERLVELHQYLGDAGKKALDEMTEVSSPSIDVTELVEKARDQVREKPALEAFAAFARICPGVRVTKLRASCEKSLRNHPLQALFSATHMSRDGRVVARTSGAGFGGVESEEYQAALWADMVKHYMMVEIEFDVRASIWPAFEVLSLEHRIRESDFVSIASRSPIVPKGRERLFGKALFAGYENDLVTALHLLTPQIEHMVRYHLKAVGAKTTTLDKEGIETENGLSTLISLPEVAQIFGDDLAFELKALFCDAFGPNLRNEVAHGLLDEDGCRSLYSLYAWWLSLKIVFVPFWNTQR